MVMPKLSVPVGICVGREDVGATVDGNPVGFLDGVDIDGIDVGFIVGASDGNRLGKLVGTRVGNSVGVLDVGTRVVD